MVDKTNVYLGSRAGQFYAIDRVTGKLRWQYSLGSAVYGEPRSSGDDLLWFPKTPPYGC